MATELPFQNKHKPVVHVPIFPKFVSTVVPAATTVPTPEIGPCSVKSLNGQSVWLLIRKFYILVLFNIQCKVKYIIVCELTMKSNFILQMSSLHGQMVYVYAPEVISLDRDKYVLFVDDDSPVVSTTAYKFIYLYYTVGTYAKIIFYKLLKLPMQQTPNPSAHVVLELPPIDSHSAL